MKNFFFYFLGLICVKIINIGFVSNASAQNNPCTSNNGYTAASCKTSFTNITNAKKNISSASNVNTAAAWHAINDNSAINDFAYNVKNITNLDATATTSFTNMPYLFVESSTNSGSQVLIIENNNGDLSNPSILRTFIIGSNADHSITVSFDAIRTIAGVCVPVFDAEGANIINGEADVISAKMTLSVGAIELFNTDATTIITGAINNFLESVVTLDCSHIPTGVVGTAIAVVTNPVASTTSIVYTLKVQAYGQNGSLIFNNSSTFNAGDAPAGTYDIDILIAAGLTNTYTLDTNDAFISSGDF